MEKCSGKDLLRGCETPALHKGLSSSCSSLFPPPADAHQKRQLGMATRVPGSALPVWETRELLPRGSGPAGPLNEAVDDTLFAFQIYK